MRAVTFSSAAVNDRMVVKVLAAVKKLELVIVNILFVTKPQTVVQVLVILKANVVRISEVQVVVKSLLKLTILFVMKVLGIQSTQNDQVSAVDKFPGSGRDPKKGQVTK